MSQIEETMLKTNVKKMLYKEKAEVIQRTRSAGIRQEICSIYINRKFNYGEVETKHINRSRYRPDYFDRYTPKFIKPNNSFRRANISLLEPKPTLDKYFMLSSQGSMHVTLPNERYFNRTEQIPECRSIHIQKQIQLLNQKRKKPEPNYSQNRMNKQDTLKQNKLYNEKIKLLFEKANNSTVHRETEFSEFLQQDQANQMLQDETQVEHQQDDKEQANQQLKVDHYQSIKDQLNTNESQVNDKSNAIEENAEQE